MSSGQQVHVLATAADGGVNWGCQDPLHDSFGAVMAALSAAACQLLQCYGCAPCQMGSSSAAAADERGRGGFCVSLPEQQRRSPVQKL